MFVCGKVNMYMHRQVGWEWVGVDVGVYIQYTRKCTEMGKHGKCHMHTQTHSCILKECTYMYIHQVLRRLPPLFTL